MPLATTVNDGAARAALADVVPRLTELIRSIRDSRAPALGEWDAGQVALHLAHAWEIIPRLARREDLRPLLRHPAELADFTTAMVRSDAAGDRHDSAARIEAAASAFLAAPIADPSPRPWLFEGTSLPASAFTCHLLNESLVHGYDIAHAEGRRWRIDPAHAGMAITGFLLPAMSALDPRFPVDQRHAAGVEACYDIRLRDVDRFFFVFSDGAVRVEPPSERRVDWHLSADPSAAFLVLWARTSLWPALLTGRLRGWGRRPALAMRLPRMMRNP
jgi:hypothetical protein